MKHLFLPYDLSLLSIGYGFNEPCFGYYNNGKLMIEKRFDKFEHNNNFLGKEIYKEEWECFAPTFQQIVDWFRDKHSITIEPKTNEDGYSFHVFKTQSELVASFFKLFGQNRSEFVYKDYYEGYAVAIREAFKKISQ